MPAVGLIKMQVGRLLLALSLLAHARGQRTWSAAAGAVPSAAQSCATFERARSSAWGGVHEKEFSKDTATPESITVDGNTYSASSSLEHKGEDWRTSSGSSRAATTTWTMRTTTSLCAGARAVGDEVSALHGLAGRWLQPLSRVAATWIECGRRPLCRLRKGTPAAAPSPL